MRAIKVYSHEDSARISCVLRVFNANRVSSLPEVARQVWALPDPSATHYKDLVLEDDDVLVLGPDFGPAAVPEGVRKVTIPMEKSLYADQALAILLEYYINGSDS